MVGAARPVEMIGVRRRVVGGARPIEMIGVLVGRRVRMVGAAIVSVPAAMAADMTAMETAATDLVPGVGAIAIASRRRSFEIPRG